MKKHSFYPKAMVLKGGAQPIQLKALFRVKQFGYLLNSNILTIDFLALVISSGLNSIIFLLSRSAS